METNSQLKNLQKAYSKLEEENNRLHSQNSLLQNQNQQLTTKCSDLEKELLKIRNETRDKEELIKKSDDLSHRICQIYDDQKDQETRYNESLQSDRRYFNSKFNEFHADAKIANDSIEDLKKIIRLQEIENKENACRFAAEIEQIKNTEQQALNAAGNYFRTYFPSIKSLQYHLETNPIVRKNQPQPKPFNFEDLDIARKNEVKKLKKKVGKMSSLQNKNDDLEQTVSCLESLNKTLSKENENLKKQVMEYRKPSDVNTLRNELERANTRIRQLESEIQDNISLNAEKEAAHKLEISQMQQLIDIEAEKSQKAESLKSKVQEQQQIIENQKNDNCNIQNKLKQMADNQAQQVVQIAKLEADNKGKDDKIRELKGKIKSLSKVPANVEVQPSITWDQVTTPEIPKEVQLSLADVVENNIMPIEARIRSMLKTLCGYYNAHQQNLESFQSKYKTKYSKQEKSLTSFLSEIGKITLNRPVNFEEIYESDEIQKDILGTVKKYVSTISDLESKVRLIQMSFPYDELTSLQEDVKHKEVEMDKIRSENKNLKKQILRRQCSLSFHNVEIFTCENDATLLHEDIKNKNGILNEMENQLKVAEHSRNSIEKKLEESKKNFTETQSKLFGCQKEIERLKKIINDKDCEISSLNQKHRNEIIELYGEKVNKADDDRGFMVKELQNLQNENNSKTEYENKIKELKTRIHFLEQELEEVKDNNNNKGKLKDHLRAIEHEKEMTQNEISKLRAQNAVVPTSSCEDKKLELIENYKCKLENSQKKNAHVEKKLRKTKDAIRLLEQEVNEINQKLLDSQKNNELLKKKIESERKSYIKQIQDLKNSKIKEYETTIDHYKKRCHSQHQQIIILTKGCHTPNKNNI